MRWLLSSIVAATLGIAVSAPSAQDKPVPERTWTLARENKRNAGGASSYLRSQSKVTVVYKEQYKRNAAGYTEWVPGPRQVTWSASREEAAFNYVHHVRGADGTLSRTRADSKTSCSGANSAVFPFGPTGLSADERAHFVMSCTTTVRVRGGGPGGGTTPSSDDRNLMLLPDPVQESDLTNCRYRETTTLRKPGDYEEETLTASLTGAVAATLEYASPEERKFVPAPGKVMKVTGKSASAVRWAFDLDPVSRLRGYATNADVDPSFFEWYELPSLSPLYDTWGPDLIFQPRTYEGTGGNEYWKVPRAGPGGNGWGRLESKKPMHAATVEVTAMDYGAHGAIRAYVKPHCGDWVEVGTALAVPVDENANHIADAEQDNDTWLDTVVSALADDDQSTYALQRGDGLTAFEEYRGFMVSPSAPRCGSWWDQTHQRLYPSSKDLFVRVQDPALSWPAHDFSRVSGLGVHFICEPQYLNDEKRIVNFTMQEQWWFSPYPLTRDWPQKGLRLVNQPLPHGVMGDAGTVGTPGDVDKIAIDLQQILEAYEDEAPWMLRGIIAHELSHGIHIEHHGTGNVPGPFVILDPVSCPARTTEGTVDGRPACLGRGLAVRHGENSGRAHCPMKYIDWHFYVPGERPLEYVGEVTFTPDRGWPWARARRVPAFRGRIAAYDKNLDEMGRDWLCNVPDGSGVNALPFDRNHASHARHYCHRQVRLKWE